MKRKRKGEKESFQEKLEEFGLSNESVKNNVERFSKNKWEVVRTFGSLADEEAYEYGEIKPRSEREDFDSFLFAFLSPQFWEFLMEIWNERLEEAK